MGSGYFVRPHFFIKSLIKQLQINHKGFIIQYYASPMINPFYPISETPSPPLGLAYLASALTAAGVEVKILDLVVFPYSQSMLQNPDRRLQTPGRRYYRRHHDI